MASTHAVTDFQGSFNSSRKLTPQAVKRIFSAADSGNTKDLMLLASEVLGKDIDLKAIMQPRQNAPTLREWAVDDITNADGTTSSDKEITDLLNNVITDREQGTFSLADLIRKSGDAVYYGQTVFEVCSTEDAKTILGFKPYNESTFNVDPAKRCLTYKDSSDNPQPLPTAQFYQCIPYINPHKEAICRISIIIHLMKNTSAWEWASYTESFAQPLIHGKVDANSQDYKKEAKAMYELMRKYAGKKFMVTSNDSGMELVETSGKGAEIYKNLLDFFKRKLSTLILGTESGLEASGRRVSEVIREDLIESDCKSIAEAITATIIRPWVKANRGPGAVVPRFYFKPRKNLKSFADNISKLSAAGFEFDEKQISELSGLTLKKKVTNE